MSRFQLYAGEFGAIGLATYKYHNLPFKSWELKCTLENENQVQLTIEAAFVTVTFHFIEVFALLIITCLFNIDILNESTYNI